MKLYRHFVWFARIEVLPSNFGKIAYDAMLPEHIRDVGGKIIGYQTNILSNGINQFSVMLEIES